MAETKIKLLQLNQEGASTGQAIRWNGSSWVPQSVGTVTSVGLSAPSQGITVSGSPITSSGTISLSLANDLAAVEGLTTTGIAVRTGTDTWTTRSVSLVQYDGAAVDTSISNADGVSGNISISFSPATLYSFKKAVRVATTANITLSGTQTIDGVALNTSDRVLVKNQTNAAENGIYIVNTSTWSRALDANSSSLFNGGVFVYVTEGTTNGGKYFRMTTSTPITLDTTNLSFSEVRFGDGIYGGSGTVNGDTVATVNSSSRFRFRANSQDVLDIDSANNTVVLRSATTTNPSYLSLSGSTAVLSTSVSNPYELRVTDTQVRMHWGSGNGITLVDQYRVNLSGLIQFTAGSTIDLSSDQNNWVPSPVRSFVRVNPGVSNVNITGIGITNQGTGALMCILNASTGTNTITLVDASSSSTFGNRFNLYGENVTIRAGETAWLIYANSAWNLFNPPHDVKRGGIYLGSGTVSGDTIATLASGARLRFSQSSKDFIDVNPASNYVRLRSNFSSGNPSEIELNNSVLTLSSPSASTSSTINLYENSIDITSPRLTTTKVKFLPLITTISSNQDNYNPTNAANKSLWLLEATANCTITGIGGSHSEGDIRIITNTGSSTLTLANNSTSSSSGNRFGLGGSDISLSYGQSVTLAYVNATWLLVSRSSGGSSGGNGIYGGSGTVNGDTVATLASGARFRFRHGSVDALDVDPNNTRTSISSPESNAAVLVLENGEVSLSPYSTVGTNISLSPSSVNLHATSSSAVVISSTDANFTTAAVQLSRVRLKTASVNLSSNQNNWAPTGSSERSMLLVNCTVASTVTGLDSSNADSALIFIRNTGTANITLADESSSSTAANRFALGGSDIVLAPGETVSLAYSGSRWRLSYKPVTAGNGIYGGSGTVSGTTNATLASGTSSLNFRTSNNQTAISISDDGVSYRFHSTTARIDFNSDGIIYRLPSTIQNYGYNGFCLDLIANETHGIGDAVYINSSGKAQLASASAFSSAGVIGLCGPGASTNNTSQYVTRGYVDNQGWSWTAGQPVYLSTSGTSGNTLTQTRPSASGTIVVPIGYAISATRIYVNPSMTLVENA